VGLSEAVADLLRIRILSGALADGDLLPKQDELVEEYGVSRPALREALRILETEGLIQVRRGNVGGAVVRIPQPEGAAYTLGLVLQARRVPFSEVVMALRHLEPVCAGLCAGRADRKKAVLPALRSSQRALRLAIKHDDSVAVVAAAREFHETLVDACGSQTLIVVVGTLEALWTAQAHSSGASSAAAGHHHDPSLRTQMADAHETIFSRIEEGDVDGASKAARLHLDTARLHSTPDRGDVAVEAAMVRDHYLRAGRETDGALRSATDRRT